jgi:GNAT superfamily N-acetyltransferase
MNLPELSSTLDPIKNRYLLAACKNPSRFLNRLSASGEQLFVCCFDLIIRRIEIYFKAVEISFLQEGLADVSRACQQIRPSPLTALVMAEDFISQSLLRQIPTQRVLNEQVVLIATKPTTLENQQVRMLSAVDSPFLDGYNDEFSSVAQLFHYHCIQHPTSEVSAWGWFPSPDRLEGICFVHCTEPMPEVLYLHIRQEARGAGGGRQLLATALNWTLTKVPALYYVTGSENQAAIRLCEHCGFTMYTSTQCLLFDLEELGRWQHESARINPQSH